jgi:hypothetical protein
MPELFGDLRYIWEGFLRLTKRRAIHMGGVGAIPYSEVAAYCDDQGFVGEEREDFIRFLDFIDDEYLKFEADRSKREAEKPAGGKPVQGR